jgi:TolB-like protein/Flp pilus assembly protein TadD/class 3 adenylate cyclase
MSAEFKPDPQLEIAHVLFIDIVGSAKLLTNEQSEVLRDLNQIVRNTEQFRAAEAAGKLIRLPTGDGMALAFFTSPEAPVRCAMEISKALRSNPKLALRMGAHSGPVDPVLDVNERSNIVGAGITMAQRVMDCGDAGHILLSKRIADDLAQYSKWQPHLHELGECEVKHGAKIDIVNLYTEELGNPATPEKLKQQRGKTGGVETIGSKPQRKKRIAVLPFKPLFPENRDQALELGMADALITKLSNSRQIIVSSLNSVRKYGDLEQDPVAAGRELQVNSILEGNVQKSGDRVRVTARLINVANGSSLWAGTFDEKFTDVFGVQDAISQKVADALALRLSGEEKKRLTKRYTENVDAYQLYLIGRYHWDKFTPPDIRKAIGFFQQAIDLDPNYALAYFGLAQANLSLAFSADVPSKDCLPQAKAAAMKGLEIDDSLAEAHASLAFSIAFFDWDWTGAEREAKRAVALNPDSGMAHFAYAHVLSNLGRHDEAASEGGQAIALEPVFPLFRAIGAMFLHHAGHNDEAYAGLQKALELEPNFWIAHITLGKVLIQQGKYAEAIAEFEKAKELSHGNSEAIASIGYVAALAGDASKARAALGELKTLSRQHYIPLHNIALVYNGLGEQSEALFWLEKACDERDVLVALLQVDPKWDSLRSNPRFVAILKRIGLQ